MKIALYARVSTEEQAAHGLSIDTQLENLRAWAKENGHVVVGEYVDAGISGKRPYAKRPALSRFMADVDAGLKVDALVFTKLDRFYRSVKLYYQAIDIMEKHNIAWQAIQEDYETVTASGRFKVNIMLSVAENEADRTSERIKVVFEAKRQRKEPVTGCVALGYKLDGKKIVKDEEKAPIVTTLFDVYQKTGSVKQAMEAVELETGYHFHYKHASDVLKNPSYYGCFSGMEDYAPPYIDKETFDRVQKMRRRTVRKTKENEVYLFTGLIVCGECAHCMTARTQPTKTARVHIYYCGYRYATRLCENSCNIYERDIENYILDTVDFQFQRYSLEAEKRRGKDDYTAKVAALKRKSEKLKDLYMTDLITLDELKQQKEEIDIQLAQIVPPKADRTADIANILSAGWREMYSEHSQTDKRAFWRTLLQQIRIYKDRHIEYDFS